MHRGFLFAVLIVGAGVLSLELGISTAIVEIFFGFITRAVVELLGISWEEFVQGGEVLEYLAAIGLMGLMFMAGFEIDVDLLKSNLKGSLSVGLPSFFLPFTLVLLAAYFILGEDWSKAALIGVALSTTSMALVFAFLRERNLIDHKLGQLLLTCAMTVDITSVIVLMIVFIRPDVLLLWEILVLVALFVLAPWLGHLLFDRYKGNVIELELRFIFLTLLGFTMVAHSSRLNEALIGFALGMIMGRLMKEHLKLVEKISGIIFSFIAPVFFFTAGTQISFLSMGIIDWLLAAVFLAVAVVAKYTGTMLPLRFFVPTTVARFAGIVFNYRLTFGIIAAVYGLTKGIINSSEYNMILIIIVLSAFLPTVLGKELPREMMVEKT